MTINLTFWRYILIYYSRKSVKYAAIFNAVFFSFLHCYMRNFQASMERLHITNVHDYVVLVKTLAWENKNFLLIYVFQDSSISFRYC